MFFLCLWEGWSLLRTCVIYFISWHFNSFHVSSEDVFRCSQHRPKWFRTRTHDIPPFASCEGHCWGALLSKLVSTNKATVAVLQNLVLCQKVLPMNEALANKERSQDTLSLFATRKCGQFPVRSTVDETSQKLVCGFGMIAKNRLSYVIITFSCNKWCTCQAAPS